MLNPHSVLAELAKHAMHYRKGSLFVHKPDTHNHCQQFTKSLHLFTQHSLHHPLLHAVAHYLKMWRKSCVAHMQPRCISTANASSEIWGASAGGAASALDGTTAAIGADMANA